MQHKFHIHHHHPQFLILIIQISQETGESTRNEEPVPLDHQTASHTHHMEEIINTAGDDSLNAASNQNMFCIENENDEQRKKIQNIDLYISYIERVMHQPRHTHTRERRINPFCKTEIPIGTS